MYLILEHTVTDHSVFMSHARKYEKEYMEVASLIEAYLFIVSLV